MMIKKPLPSVSGILRGSTDIIYASKPLTSLTYKHLKRSQKAVVYGQEEHRINFLSMALDTENMPEEAITSSVTRSCLRNFQNCIEHTEAQDRIRFETKFADFKLWVDSVGAAAQAKSSLDWRFRSRPGDIRFIQGLLSMLEELLLDYSKAAVNKLNLREAVANIDSTMDTLAFIGVQIRRSGRKSRLRKADDSYASKRNEYRNLRAHLACVLTARPTESGRPKDEGIIIHSVDYFLRLELSPIQERLVEAVIRRRHRFVMAQRHSEGLRGTSTTSSRIETFSQSGAIAPIDTVEMISPPKATNMHNTRQTVQENTARATSASGLESRFAGLTTRRKAGSTVTRITNITAATKYPRAHTPTNVEQKLVHCPCCCQAIPATDLEDNQWRKHVANDVCPYTCFLSNCPTPFAFFVTREEWNDHILEDHSPQWQCPLCEGDPPRYERLSEFTAHALAEHSITIDTLQETLVNAEVNVLGITECPLCDSKGPEDSPDLIEHVLQHVHDFSLRSLPWTTDPVIRLNKVVGEFDMTHAQKKVKDDEGNEHIIDIAGWSLSISPSFGLGNDPQDSDHDDSRAGLRESDNPQELQLCEYDKVPPQLDEDERLAVARIENDHFSRHDYFKDESSDGRLSSQPSRSSQPTHREMEADRTRLQKQWACTICSMTSTGGDDAFWEHLSTQHAVELDDQKISGTVKDEWKQMMLAEAYWNGLEAIIGFESTSLPNSRSSSPSREPLHGSSQQTMPRSGFVFRIDEFTEHPEAAEQVDNYGRWIPTAIKGYNIRVAGGASGQWWYCDEHNIRPLPDWSPPQGSKPYSACSTIYSGGHGFFILEGDATNPGDGETWHPLRFDWDQTTYSSFLSNAGAERTLRVQNNEKRWPFMLLPDIYHGAHYPHVGYGGFTGKLAILLALVALSMKPERLATELPMMMHNGEWCEHSHPHGRTDKRGVIVYVYTNPDNYDNLEAREDGSYGMYYQ